MRNERGGYASRSFSPLSEEVQKLPPADVRLEDKGLYLEIDKAETLEWGRSCRIYDSNLIESFFDAEIKSAISQIDVENADEIAERIIGEIMASPKMTTLQRQALCRKLFIRSFTIYDLYIKDASRKKYSFDFCLELEKQ